MKWKYKVVEVDHVNTRKFTPRAESSNIRRKKKCTMPPICKRLHII